MHSHLKERWFIPWWLKTSSTNALFGQNGNISCDQWWMSEQLMAVGEQSLTTLSEATYWCKKLLNYSLGYINKFPEHLGGSYPSWFTSTSIYSTISSSADSGSGKLSTLLFQPDMSLWGSNCLCSVTAFWEDALHQRKLLSEFRKIFLTWALPVPHLTPSICTWTTFQLPPPLGSPVGPSPEPFLQRHCCSTTTEKFHFPSQSHPFLKLQRKSKSCSRRHLATELTPKETPNITPIRILNYRRLTITIRRCSKSSLQYQMDLAINSQTLFTAIF